MLQKWQKISRINTLVYKRDVAKIWQLGTMEIRELFLSLISFAIFIWGIATKRYGTASIIIFLLLIFANNLFLRDVAIVSLVALIILDGKRKGKIPYSQNIISIVRIAYYPSERYW
jgi:CBS domain containing-hemolysin-like protein